MTTEYRYVRKKRALIRCLCTVSTAIYMLILEPNALLAASEEVVVRSFAVPEPGGFLALASGIIGLTGYGIRRWKRRQTH